jgi:asparagine synthase (glutamine-hydrolysing)
MCGIVGSVQVGSAEPYRDEVKCAVRAMAHRGPDGEGFREFRLSKSAANSGEGSTATVLMGHRRLAIIDLSEAARQPMSTPGSCVHIIFNGEIYNYRELRSELKSLGRAFLTRSDTEVLLVGWQQWGTNLFSRLIGMFSFALLDQHNSALVLARDPFGIKPLYYAQAHQSFVFASELAPLLNFPGVSRQADPQTLFEFVSGGMGDHSNKTFFQNIHQLPPAHYLSVACHSPGTAEPVSYWELEPKPTVRISAKEASSRFRDLFEESIELHLRSDVPIGVSLSGGMDSSAITAMVRSVQGPDTPLQTFSYIADDLQLSEERWCAIVARATSAHQHLVRIQPNEVIGDFQRLVRVQEQPFGSPTIYAQYRIFRCAHEAGLKVILTGQGSDQYLGYVRHVSVRLASLLRNGRLVEGIRLLRRAQSSSARGVLNLRSVARQLLPGRLVEIARRLRTAALPGLNVDWFRQHGLDPSRSRHPAGYCSLHELLKRNVLETLPSLLRFEDRNAMAFSVENRVPFLTTKLLEFVFSLPEEEVISGEGQSKAVLLRAMQGVVPVEILERRDKIGFAMPISKLNRQVKPWLQDLLSDAEDIPVLNVSEVKRQLSASLSDRSTDTGAQRVVWRWLSLIAWAREFRVCFD